MDNFTLVFFGREMLHGVNYFNPKEEKEVVSSQKGLRFVITSY